MTEHAATSGDDVSVADSRTDGTQTLLVADFADTAAALEAYEALQAIEATGRVAIEGAVVVSKAADGTLTVQETTDSSPGRGARWGAIGGAVIGLLFPPSILGSAVLAGIIGAAIGKGVKVAHSHRLADELHYSIDPGHSGLVALVSDPDAVEIAEATKKATRIVRKTVEDTAVTSIRTAAQQAESEARAD